MHVKVANSVEDSLPVAMVDMNIPYVKGRVAAACFTGLNHDLILGSYYVLSRPNPETCTPVGAMEARAQEVAMKMRSLEVVVETNLQGHQAKIEPIFMTDMFV